VSQRNTGRAPARRASTERLVIRLRIFGNHIAITQDSNHSEPQQTEPRKKAQNQTRTDSSKLSTDEWHSRGRRFDPDRLHQRSHWQNRPGGKTSEVDGPALRRV
jgi:hypothetical protein